MTSRLCSTCSGHGTVPGRYYLDPGTTCNICGGGGWVEERVVVSAKPEPLQTYTRTPEELAKFQSELDRRYAS